MNKKMPKSLRKFIRIRKSQIRKSVLNFEDQQRMISELYNKLARKPEIKEKSEVPKVKENKAKVKKAVKAK